MSEFRWDLECPNCSTRPGGSYPEFNTVAQDFQVV